MIVQRTALSRHIAVSQAQIAAYFNRVEATRLAIKEHARRVEEAERKAKEESRLELFAANYRAEQKRAKLDLPAGIVPVPVIVQACADAYGVSVIDILSHRRTVEVVRPRQIAMYLAKIMTTRSLPEIGRRIGDRDHTTVLHGVRKIADLIQRYPKFAAEVEAIRQAISAR